MRTTDASMSRRPHAAPLLLVLVLAAACGDGPGPAGSATTPTTPTGPSTVDGTTTGAASGVPSASLPPVATPPTVLGPLAAEPVLEPAEGERWTNPGAVVADGGRLHLFRNSFSAFPGPARVDHLVSDDGGRAWTPTGDEPVLTDADVPYTDGTVFLMAAYVADDGTWVGFPYTYEGRTERGVIGRATAPAPEGPWTVDPEPVLEPGPEGAWDDRQVGEPSVLATAEGARLYYVGRGSDGTVAIGSATSTDGVTWTKHDDPSTTAEPLAASDPVYAPDQAWAASGVGDPQVLPVGDGFLLLHDAGDAATGIGIAFSADGVTWAPSGANPVADRQRIGRSFFQAEAYRTDDGVRLLLEEGGTSATVVRLYDVDVDAARDAPRLTADVTIEGADVTIAAAAAGLDLRFDRDDASGATAHPHALVDRRPPRPGEVLRTDDPTIVHATGSTIRVEGLEPGSHTIEVVLADGADRVLAVPAGLRYRVEIAG